MPNLRPYHEILETACAIHRAKTAYLEDESSLEKTLDELRKHRLLAPHIDEVHQRLSSVLEQVKTSYYGQLVPEQRDKPIQVIPVGTDIMGRLVAEYDPNMAHRKGIRALSAEALQEYKKKHNRGPPGFVLDPFAKHGKMIVYPWGIHLVLLDPGDYARFGLAGSGGFAHSGALPISFSTNSGELMLHETDHSFFHTLFSDNPPFDQQAQEADRRFVLTRVPTFLTEKQKESFLEHVFEPLVHYGYWQMRNETHSYVNPLTEKARIASGSHYSWTRLRPLIIRRAHRLIRRAEFEHMPLVDQRDLLLWVQSECDTVRKLIRTNVSALTASPIDKRILSKIPLFFPYHQLARRLEKLNQAYVQRKEHYDRAFGKTESDVLQDEKMGMVEEAKAKLSDKKFRRYLKSKDEECEGEV